MTKDYYVLGTTEETYFTFVISFLIPLSIGMGVVILRSLLSKETQEKNKLNPYRKTSLKLGICYIILFECFWGHVLFIGNDLFFDIDIRNPTISIFNNAISASYYFTSKAMLYYALTYYHQSLLYDYDNNHRVSKFMIAWMAMGGIIWAVIGTVFIVDDAMESSSKEIGFLPNKNIHFSVYMGHEGAPLGTLAFVVIIIFDFAYFAVLGTLFVSSIRKMKNDENMNENQLESITQNSLRALVLIVFTCIIFWTQCVTIAMTLDIRWIFGAIDAASDAICVYFLLVESNLYWTFFGLFHGCFGKCIYGSKYKKIPQRLGYDPVNMDDSEAVQDVI